MRVSVINSVCRKRDAIGESVHETCRAIMDNLHWDCRLFTFDSDFEDVDTKRVTGVVDVLDDSFFATSDIHLFHFGFYSPLFTLLGAGTASTKRVVCFHNVTPKEFVPEEVRPMIDRSLEQIALIDEADEVWAVSPYNRNDLVEYGIDPKRILIEPLFSKAQYAFDGVKTQGVVNMLYVGRFVGSKGVLDLVEAIARVRRETRVPIQVDLVGSQSFSSAIYIQAVKDRIAALQLQDVVSFVGELDDQALMTRYHAAHLVVIPSYHEGFCVPLVEALHAKAIPIAYGAGNIPFLLDGVGEVVPVGNVDALAASLLKLVDWHGATWQVADRRRPAGPLPFVGGAVDAGVYAKRVAAQAELYSVESFRQRIANRLIALANEP